MKVEQALENATADLEAASLWFGHGTDNAWDEASLLLLKSLNLESADASILQHDLEPEQIETFNDLIRQRISTRKPAAYLVGEAWFCGLRFSVDERVLVPRSPIAELIVKRFSPWLLKPPERILDLCTGSGCIGIAAAIAFPAAEVTLADLSEDALCVARENRTRHGLEQRCHIVESDLFTDIESGPFDLILCNPPYVDASDIAEMPDEYRAEPQLGLAAGEDGLDLVRHILVEAENHLNDEGVLVLEVGNSWVAMEQAYPGFPFVWVEFEFGGSGVCLIEKSQLVAFRDQLQAAYNAGLT